MTRCFSLLLLLASASVASANAAPPRYVPCVRQVKLVTPAPGYAFYTLRTEDSAAELTPLKLTADAWAEIPTRKTDKAEKPVVLY